MFRLERPNFSLPMFYICVLFFLGLSGISVIFDILTSISSMPFLPLSLSSIFITTLKYECHNAWYSLILCGYLEILKNRNAEFHSF